MTFTAEGIVGLLDIFVFILVFGFSDFVSVLYFLLFVYLFIYFCANCFLIFFFF